ncbi:hypothetical protein HerbRD11066_78310 [Herbidospora sp. RD11066]
MTLPKRDMPQTSLEIALEWSKLPPRHLEVALKALNPQLEREHQLRLLQLQLEAQEKKESRKHAMHMVSIGVGCLVALAMLGAAVVLGINDQPWLAAILAGPSVLALVKVFVLRRTDPVDMEKLFRSQRAVLSAMPQQATPAPAPAEPGQPAAP